MPKEWTLIESTDGKQAMEERVEAITDICLLAKKKKVLGIHSGKEGAAIILHSLTRGLDGRIFPSLAFDRVHHRWQEGRLCRGWYI